MFMFILDMVEFWFNAFECLHLLFLYVFTHRQNFCETFQNLGADETEAADKTQTLWTLWMRYGPLIEIFHFP